MAHVRFEVQAKPVGIEQKLKCDALQALVDEERRPDTDRRFFERIVEDAMRRLGHTQKPPPEKSAGDWLREWLANQQASVSQATFQRYALAIRLFIDTLDIRAAKPLSEIDTSDLIRFRERLLKAVVA